MNERQLPGLSLDFPRGSREGSTQRRTRAMLRLQRRHHDSSAERSEHSKRTRAADHSAWNADSATFRSSRRTVHPVGSAIATAHC
jgi:hypothetical protein